MLLRKIKCFLGFHSLKEIKKETLDFYWFRVTYKCEKCNKLIYKDEMSL